MICISNTHAPQCSYTLKLYITGTQTRAKKLVPRELSSESKEESESTRDGTSPSSQPNVLDDDGFPTYARLRKEHPYDKLRKCMLLWTK